MGRVTYGSLRLPRRIVRAVLSIYCESDDHVTARSGYDRVSSVAPRRSIEMT